MTTPAPVEYESLNASTFKPLINTGTHAAPVWVFIGGIDTVTPTENVNEVDDSDFETAGYKRTLATSRSEGFTFSGKRRSTTDGDRDPGQAAVEALSRQLGAGRRAEFQILLGDSGESLFFRGSVGSNVKFGGGVDALAMWNVTVSSVGPATEGPSVLPA